MTKRLPFFLGCFFILVFAVLAFRGRDQDDAIPVKGYTLFWHDEFMGTKLDKTKWSYRGLGKRNDAYVTERSVSVDGKGCLVIEASRHGDSLFTGMIATENIFTTRYGYFECRASFAKARGVFSQFWLQSQINGDGGRPETNGAELDIFEYFSNINKNQVAHTLHWGGYGPTHHVEGPVWGTLRPSPEGFHIVGLEWTATGYTTFVDGVKTYSGNSSISRVAEFIVLSLGINKAAAGPVNPNDLPDRYMVDYVRVYKKNQ